MLQHWTIRDEDTRLERRNVRSECNHVFQWNWSSVGTLKSKILFCLYETRGLVGHNFCHQSASWAWFVWIYCQTNLNVKEKALAFNFPISFISYFLIVGKIRRRANEQSREVSRSINKTLNESKFKFENFCTSRWETSGKKALLKA